MLLMDSLGYIFMIIQRQLESTHDRLRQPLPTLLRRNPLNSQLRCQNDEHPQQTHSPDGQQRPSNPRDSILNRLAKTREHLSS